MPVETEKELIRETENVIWIGETGFEAYADNVIVLQDEFRSGHECLMCLAKDIRQVSEYSQKSFIPCPDCKGKGNRPKAGNSNLMVKCSECEGKGSVICPECGGTGGTIAVAEQAKGAPTTGKVVSIGSDVPKDKFQLGMRVMYPSYSGHRYAMTAKTATGEKEVVLMFLNHTNIISRLHGVLEMRSLKSAQARYTAE